MIVPMKIQPTIIVEVAPITTLATGGTTATNPGKRAAVVLEHPPVVNNRIHPSIIIVIAPCRVNARESCKETAHGHLREAQQTTWLKRFKALPPHHLLPETTP